VSSGQSLSMLVYAPLNLFSVVGQDPLLGGEDPRWRIIFVVWWFPSQASVPGGNVAVCVVSVCLSVPAFKVPIPSVRMLSPSFFTSYLICCDALVQDD
jgi:hypothetical protein